MSDHRKKFLFQASSRNISQTLGIQSGKTSVSKHRFRRDSTSRKLRLSVPGVEQVISNNRSIVSKNFWCIFVLGFYGLCGFQLYDRISLYFQFPTQIEIRLQPNDFIVTPSFAICQEHKDVVAILSRRRDEEQKLEEINQKPPNVNLSEIWDLLKVEIENFKVRVVNDEILWKNNDTNTFTFSFLHEETIHGKCLTFTPRSLLPYVGPNTGIRVEMKTNHPSFILRIRSNYTVGEYKVGVRSLKLYQNYTEHFQVYKRKFIRYNSTFRPCFDKTSVAACERKCIQNAISSSINCRLQFMTYLNHTICSSVTAAIETLNKTNYVYIHTNCSCPTNCETESLTFFGNSKRLRDGWIQFSLEFPNSVNQIAFETPAYTLSGLASDIGGNLGFYVGLSLFNFVDLFEHAIVILLGYMKFTFWKKDATKC